MSDSAWSEDPEAFREHFGLAYDDFCVLLQALPADVKKKYDKTLEIDNEAGIIFALHKGKKLGLLTDEEEKPERQTREGESAILREQERYDEEMRQAPFRVFERGGGGWYFATVGKTLREAIAAADEKMPFVVQESPTRKSPAGKIVYQEKTEGLPDVPYRLLTRWPIDQHDSRSRR
jgi:hypothetical protein